MPHKSKSVIFENNGLTIGEQKNAIKNFYNLLLTDFRHMLFGCYVIVTSRSKKLIGPDRKLRLQITKSRGSEEN